MATRAAAAAPPALSWSCVYPAQASEVARARRFLADVLDGCPAAGDAVLCLSEIVTNSVMHSDSRKPGGFVTVRADLRRGDRLRVEVEDQGGPWSRRSQAPGPHGHGLFIVSQLASNWGISGDSQAGRTVWFELDGP